MEKQENTAAEKLKQSWSILKDAPPVNNEPPLLAFIATFYDHLFTHHPEHKKLFKSTDMKEQGKKLVKIIGISVVSAEDFEKLRETIDKLGSKHASFGVYSEQQYQDVCDALLFALEKHLGDQWNDELAKIWRDTYMALVEVMIAGGKKYAPKEKPGKSCVIS